MRVAVVGEGLAAWYCHCRYTRSFVYGDLPCALCVVIVRVAAGKARADAVSPSVHWCCGIPGRCVGDAETACYGCAAHSGRGHCGRMRVAVIREGTACNTDRRRGLLDHESSRTCHSSATTGLHGELICACGNGCCGAQRQRRYGCGTFGRV